MKKESILKNKKRENIKEKYNYIITNKVEHMREKSRMKEEEFNKRLYVKTIYKLINFIF